MHLEKHRTPASCLMALGLMLLAMSAEARELRNPVVIGEAEVRLLGFKLYDARLLTSGGSRFDPAKPHALELRYARSFDRESLLNATRKEMERIQGSSQGVGPTIESLRPCFRDVASGDRFKATALAPDSLSFHFNGSQTCSVQAPSLASRFLSIWLSDKARDPELSRRLRGSGAGQ